MRIFINYGDRRLRLEIPDNGNFDEFHNPISDISIGYDEFIAAVESGERDLFSVSGVDLFIINDAYRPTPSAKILKWLDEADRLNSHARIIIATGCHGKPTDKQLEITLGALYERFKERVLIHDAHDIQNMVTVGQDSGGEPIRLNRTVIEARRIAVIGSVEPHYFAGFTGGRKSIFPGLCDYETTVRNHNRAISFEAMPMKLDGNPIEEHLRTLMRLITGDNIFSIQLVAGDGGKLQAVFCGQLDDSFRKAVQCSIGIFGHKINRKYDLLLAEVAPPLDSNLYQLQKSLENCQPAVTDNGTVIIFSPCREGIGSNDFYRLAEEWAPDKSIMPGDESSFGRHKVYRVYQIGRRINVWLYSELENGVSDVVYFKTIREPQKVIDDLGENNALLRTALVHDAGHTVLVN
nr:DUF2088 domain-containing protein [candidate division Zixibacteria bacterium]